MHALLGEAAPVRVPDVGHVGGKRRVGKLLAGGVRGGAVGVWRARTHLVSIDDRNGLGAIGCALHKDQPVGRLLVHDGRHLPGKGIHVRGASLGPSAVRRLVEDVDAQHVPAVCEALGELGPALERVGGGVGLVEKEAGGVGAAAVDEPIDLQGRREAVQVEQH
eukprot:scaffold122134_cov48-Phaeocystis_antarctica.AAC.2